MAITYEEALATLEAMFGEPWTRETLDAVLRHEKGHMENTCERILNHGERDPQVLVDRLRSGDAADPQLSIDEELARQFERQQNAAGNAQAPPAAAAAAAASSSTSSANTNTNVNVNGRVRRGKPTALPPDFLRVPGYKYPPESRSASASLAGGAAMDDETLARMLQDELFSQELARNPDFAHLARGRNASASSRQSRRSGRGAAGSRTSYPPATRRTGSSSATMDDRPKIFDKISEMSDNARKRLALFATQFEQRLNARNSASSSRSSGGSGFLNGGVSGMNSPTGAVSERRGLLDDDFEDTIEFETRKNQ